MMACRKSSAFQEDIEIELKQKPHLMEEWAMAAKEKGGEWRDTVQISIPGPRLLFNLFRRTRRVIEYRTPRIPPKEMRNHVQTPNT